jgi:hypothetical protein
LQQQRSSSLAPIDRMASHDGRQHHRHAIDGNHEGPSYNDAVPVAHNDQPTRDAHGCLKCCGICMLASVIPRAPDWTVAATVSGRVLALPGVPSRGHIVFVDPDIPKQIV